MKTPIIGQILETIESSPTLLQVDELVTAVSQTARRRPARVAIDELVSSGHLFITPRDHLVVAPGRSDVIGTFKRHVRGFGFCIPEHPAQHDDLFIPPGKHAGALDGDLILVRALKRGHRGGRPRFEGRVLDVLERARVQFVGPLQRQGRSWLIRPEGVQFPAPLYIADAPASGAQENDQVVVQIITFPDDTHDAEGVIVEILGERGVPAVDTLSIIRQHDIPEGLSDACADEARRLVERFDPQAAAADRLDLRDELTITIDPKTARDFDDAISVTRDQHGWQLGIHIADVAHFVHENGAIDLEARLRGNSVYFPDHVEPMIPEVLSNGVCSLQEGVDRLTFSAIVRIDDEGRVSNEKFGRSIIRSNKRLTYEEVTHIIEGKTGGFDPIVIELIAEMERLARCIRQRRIDDGMIVLTLPTPALITDDDGYVTDIQPEDQSFSHVIIEMFMIEANEAVARHLAKHDVSCLRRVHPQPEPGSGEILSSQLRAMGRDVPESMKPVHLQRLLAEIANTPQSFSVNLAVLKCMKRAEYAPVLDGHFALASTDYCHFTSPIRRYPDLTIHRQLAATLAGEPFDSAIDLSELGRQCSYTERRAEEAERELRSIRVLRFLEAHHLGSTCIGVVNGLTDMGLFVHLERWLTEGFIPVETLPGKEWEYDREAWTMRAVRGKQRIVLGDVVEAKLARVDVALRRLELTWEKTVSTSAPVTTASRPRKKKTTRKNTKRGGPPRKKRGRAAGRARNTRRR